MNEHTSEQERPRPLIDVYLVHWRAPDWCVRSTASVLASEGVDVRCHVVDNGSTGGDALARALDARVHVLSPSDNLGYTGGANLGLTNAMGTLPRAEFVVVGAHDLLVEPETLATMSAVARADARIGILGPILTAPAVSAGGMWRGWRAKAQSTWDETVPFEVREWLSGTMLMIRPECLADIGGFDSTLGSYVEDVDICLRAKDAGWRVGIATAARARGIGSASSTVTVRVDVNSVHLAVKRGGMRKAFPICARYAYWSVRGLLTAILPGRDRVRRRASLEHARDHLRAIGQVIRRRNQLHAAAVRPNDGTPRFDVPPSNVLG